jgi:Flp pilus assembly protein TadD
VCGVTSALILAALMGGAWRQTSFWRDSETLWTHSLACTTSNCLAHNSLGAALAAANRAGEAIPHFQQALEVNGGYFRAQNNLANALVQQGRPDEAIAHYRKALEIKPDYAEAHSNLGGVLRSRGRIDEAIAHLQRAVEIDPGGAEIHVNLANALAAQGNLDDAVQHYLAALRLNPRAVPAHTQLAGLLSHQGKPQEAEVHFREAMRLEPSNAEACSGLAVALQDQGRIEEALRYYQESLRLWPDQPNILNNLAWIRATHPDPRFRDGGQALAAAKRAVELSRGEVRIVDTLAAAYAEAGRFPEALATARKALDLAVQQNNPALADTLRARIALYEAGKPFHQTPSTPARLPPKP